MAVQINWATKRITVPKADLTLISGTLYEHDTDAFRLELRSLEDDEVQLCGGLHRLSSVSGPAWHR